MIKINKNITTGLLTFMFSGCLAASDMSGMKEGLIKCTDIVDNLARLTCFDSLAKPLVSTQVQLSNNTISVVKAKQVLVDSENLALVASVKQREIEEAFAKPQLKNDDVETERISLTISKLSKTLRGQWKVSFSNGQVWQQKDSLRLSLKLGDLVELNKGALGAYFMKKSQSNKRIRVKRLK